MIEKTTLTSDEHGDDEKSPLKLSGYVYLVSDAALFASGMLSGRYREASSGLLYMGAAGVLARYGRQDADHQLKELTKHLSGYLKKEGVELPESGMLSEKALRRDPGIIHKIENFLYAHPSEVANAFFAYGGSQLLRSGLTHNKQWDTLGGAAVTAGALAGILIPETKEKLPRTRNPITNTWNAIREKPLFFTGSAYMLGNAALLSSAVQERKANPASKSYLFKVVTASGYIIANSLLATSSKDSSIPEDKELNKVYQGAADIIATQPKKIRDATLRHVAEFISAQPETGSSRKEVEAQLRHAVELYSCKEKVDDDYRKSWRQTVSESDAKPPSMGI